MICLVGVLYNLFMKIALDCRSILLEKSLRKFLKPYLVDETQAEIFLVDHVTERRGRIVLRIGSDSHADLPKPFSRSQLMLRLEKALEKRHGYQALDRMETPECFEEKIEEVVRRFVEEIVTLTREHYGQK